jgi:hypothetical protein
MVAAVAANTIWKTKKVKGPAVCLVSLLPAKSKPVGAEEATTVAEHEAKPNEPEGATAHAKVHQVLHHDVGGILGAGKARLHHGEPCLHEEHQGCCHDRPNNVSVFLNCLGLLSKGSSLAE